MQLTRLVAALGLLAATSAFSLAPARPARALLSPAASAAVQPSMFFGAKAAAPKARLLRCTATRATQQSPCTLPPHQKPLKKPVRPVKKAVKKPVKKVRIAHLLTPQKPLHRRHHRIFPARGLTH